MTFIADSEGKVHVSVEADGVRVAFTVTSDHGRAFAPGEAVEIADERIAQIVAPFIRQAAAA